MSDKIIIDLDLLFGRCEIEQRQIPGDDNDILFQGRSKHYDRHGALTKVTEWETVSRMYWPKPGPKVSWWRHLFG